MMHHMMRVVLLLCSLLVCMYVHDCVCLCLLECVIKICMKLVQCWFHYKRNINFSITNRLRNNGHLATTLFSCV
jgi:hypothetical protein